MECSDEFEDIEEYGICIEENPVEIFFSNKLENLLDMYDTLNYHFPYIINNSKIFVSIVVNYIFHNGPTPSDYYCKNKKGDYTEEYNTIKYIIQNFMFNL